MTVLVCTSSLLQDRHVPTVIDAVRSRGVDCVVLDTARFPLESTLTLDAAGTASLRVGDRAVDLAALRSVWMLHLNVGDALGDDVDEAFHQIVSVQSNFALNDALAMSDALFVDHPDALERFPIGIHQLRLAAASGLNVPRTICTDDPSRVRELFDACGGRIVAKMMQSSAILRDTPKGPRAYEARLLGPEEMEHIDRVSLCPQIFQEAIDKALELRVTVVGPRLFPAAVDTSHAKVLDWGQDPELVRAFEPYDDLPEEVAGAIERLMTRLRLNFGTVDLIVTPAGEYVFLEVNSVSFFDFIVDATGLPICDALAELLLGETKPRVRIPWAR